MVKKYVNPRISGYRDESHAVRDIGVFGADARRIVATITGVERRRRWPRCRRTRTSPRRSTVRGDGRAVAGHRRRRLRAVRAIRDL